MAMRAARFAGALSILGVGAVHLQQYETGYSAIPTIGRLFLLNAISAGAVGFGLLLPLQRKLGQSRGAGAVSILALGGLAIAVGSLVALFISETGTLFGFSEHGYDTPIVVAIAFEAVATLLLTALAAISFRRAIAQPTRRAQPAQRPRRPADYAPSRSA